MHKHPLELLVKQLLIIGLRYHARHCQLRTAVVKSSR